MFKQIEESIRLNELREKFNTAEKQNKTECQKCGFCCYKRTCVTTPDELSKIAEFLKLSIVETIQKYYCIDTLDYQIYFVKPAGYNQLDIRGKKIPPERTFNEGKCIFLSNNDLCEIYPVRPLSARLMECWDKTDIKVKDEKHIEIVNSWKNNKLKEIYPTFNK